jgi:acyl-CoA synthetase (NDP forming)
MDLAPLLEPRSIAIVGASPDPHILRGRTLKVMLRHPYRGRVYPISRSHAEVQGLKAYASVADVPERVDLAVLIIPAEFVPDELERCGKAGVRAALILTSGFAEEGEGGRDLQQRIRDTARRHSLIVCGPNTEGFANTALALCPTFSPAVDELAVPLVPPWRTRGHVAVLAQSGGMGFAFFDRGRPKEIPFSYIVTTGNEACLESFDVVEHLLANETTSVFLMFVENLKSARTFRRVAARALELGKPIIVAKIGASDAGQRAAISHTAALAGSDVIYRAMFHHYGIIEGTDSEAMVDIANAFSLCADRLPAGRRVGIGTASGGGGGWLADACVAAGLEVPELDVATRAKLDAHLPAYGTSQNPVDGTAQAIREIGYSELARLIAESERVDAVIMVITARSVETLARERENLFRVAREVGKPILMWSYTLPCAAALQLLSEAGYPLFTHMHNCARALRAMADYRASRERWQAASGTTYTTDPTFQSRAHTQLVATSAALCEYEAAAILAGYGMLFARGELARTEAEAIAIAARLGPRVALKVQSPDLPHKTDAGAVVLDVSCDTAAPSYAAVIAAVEAHAPGAQIRGVLVQAMARPGREMIVGVRRDPLFGPIVMVGVGGIHVEVLRDAAFAPAPLSVAQARELIDSLRARQVLDAVRGAPAADVDALADLLVRVSHFAFDHADTIEEIDLNPVVVHAVGEGVTAVDALIVKRAY